MPQRAAQRAHVGLGPTGPSEEPVGRQTLQPLAIEAIGCGSAGDTLGLAGSTQEHLPAPGFSQCKHRNPVDPGGCHGDGGDATVEEPVGQSVEGSREGAETAHGLGVASQGYGAPVLRLANVDASGVGMGNLEGLGEPG